VVELTVFETDTDEMTNPRRSACREEDYIIDHSESLSQPAQNLQNSFKKVNY